MELSYRVRCWTLARAHKDNSVCALKTHEIIGSCHIMERYLNSLEIN